MNRRELAKGICCALVGSVMPSSDPPIGVSPPTSNPRLAKTVAGVRIVDSKIAIEATELARQSSPEFLFNHAMRTYLFGALAGKVRGCQFDDELLYLACILHDIGLTENFMGPLPFEVQGAQAAAEFLEKRGVSGDQRSVIWDAIALHASAAGGFKRPEISLVGVGAGYDVIGPDSAELTREATEDVVRAFPRLRFKTEFVKTCATVVRRYPNAASSGFMRDIRDRHMPDFHARNACDRIAESSFDE
jgi:hypothetical protein